MAPSTAAGVWAMRGPRKSSTVSTAQGGGQRVSLAACARRVGEGRTAGAAADREAVQDACSEVGGAQGEQLAVGVERAGVVVGGEGPCREDHVRVADEQDPEGGQQQVGQIGNAGQFGAGRPTGTEPITVIPYRSSSPKTATAAVAATRTSSGPG